MACTSTGTWTISIGIRQNTDGVGGWPTGLIRVSMCSLHPMRFLVQPDLQFPVAVEDAEGTAVRTKVTSPVGGRRQTEGQGRQIRRMPAEHPSAGGSRVLPPHHWDRLLGAGGSRRMHQRMRSGGGRSPGFQYAGAPSLRGGCFRNLRRNGPERTKSKAHVPQRRQLSSRYTRTDRMAGQPFGTSGGRPREVAYREVRHAHRATPLSGRAADSLARSHATAVGYRAAQAQAGKG